MVDNKFVRTMKENLQEKLDYLENTNAAFLTGYFDLFYETIDEIRFIKNSFISDYLPTKKYERQLKQLMKYFEGC